MSGCCEEKFNNFLLNDKRGWWTNFGLNTFDKMIPESMLVKDFKDLPSFPMYLAAAIFNLVWWAVFLYFIITAYQSGVTDTYISFDEESGDCSEVPFTVTGNYLADSSGHWESNKKYNDATALYEADFLSFESTNAQYKKTFAETISNELNEIGNVGKYRDLAWNVLALASYTYVNRDHGRLEFYPTGEIGTMVNLRYSQAGVAGSDADVKDGGCLKSVSFDAATVSLVASYPYEGSGTSCQKFADTLGFDSVYSETFEFSVDMVAVSTATAVNYGIITPKKLTAITDDPKKGYTYDTDDGGDDDGSSDGSYYSYESYGDDTYSYYGSETDDGSATDDGGSTNRTAGSRRRARQSNTPVERNQLKASVLEENIRKYSSMSNSHRSLKTTSTGWKLYYDAKYDGMTPVACITFNQDSAQSVCFLRFRDADLNFVYAYPVVKHYRGTNCYDDTKWGPTWYNSDPTTNGKWVATEDHTFDIMVGLIVFTSAADAKDFAAEANSLKVADPVKGDLVIPDRVFGSLRSVVDGTYVGLENATNFYNESEVCGFNNKTGLARDCFLWGFDQYGPDYYVNPHNYQLFAGACRNSLYNSVTMTGLAQKSPQPLVETYYECTMRPYDSFFNALGLSLGNADVYTKFSFFGFMLLFMYYLWKSRGFDPKLGEFESKEQEEAQSKQNPDNFTATNPIQGIELKDK